MDTPAVVDLDVVVLDVRRHDELGSGNLLFGGDRPRHDSPLRGPAGGKGSSRSERGQTGGESPAPCSSNPTVIVGGASFPLVGVGGAHRDVPAVKLILSSASGAELPTTTRFTLGPIPHKTS